MNNNMSREAGSASGGKKEIEQPNNELTESSDMETLELKANLNPEQRVYLEVLKDRMKKILGGKTKQELAKAGDLASLTNYKSVLTEILEFLKTKKIPIKDLVFTSAEGKEVRIEMAEQLGYWTDFYKAYGIDWIKMPEKITLTPEDRKELTKGAKALCPDGNFEKLKMLIIPAGLADTGEKYKKLYDQMSQGYKETWQSNELKTDGEKNKSDKLKLILVKDVQNFEDDKLYKSTLNQSVNQLEAKGGIFEQTGLRGIDTSVYLVWQREYFERTGKHLDENGLTWLTENRRPPSGRVADSCWDSDSARLRFNAYDPDFSSDLLGCRLSSSREK